MPPKAGPSGFTLAAFLPAQLKPEPSPEPAQQGPPRPPRCRCEGPFDLCWRYPANVVNPTCKPTWDRLLAPFQFKGREWTIVELRALWPHTVQALNERLLKGRMERTLKEDLQDDLQVLVDLIQHSCKPHPRPPRAGMKTLIVQGRILAEAIAQDALFQLDPADPSAAAAAGAGPTRSDLVDLINRLRDHHPNSLLGPALHALRTLGNTAVHLDRDSARLTDGEIGDAAAVCCRMVVHVVDAYMHMCANLHRHDQTEAALAQPLQEAPVAPIPAPNVLLRPREVAAPTAAAEEAVAARVPSAGAAANGAFGRAGSGRGAPAAAVAAGGSGGDEDALVFRAAGGSRRQSGGGGSGNGRSHGSSMDGSGARAPYSLFPSDWGSTAAAAAPATSDVNGAARPLTAAAADASPSRAWWPPLAQGEALALAALPPPSPSPPLPLNLLRRPAATEAAEAAAAAAAGGSGGGFPPPQDGSPQAASVSDWLQGLSLAQPAAAGGLWPGSYTAPDAPYTHPSTAFPVGAADPWGPTSTVGLPYRGASPPLPYTSAYPLGSHPHTAASAPALHTPALLQHPHPHQHHQHATSLFASSPAPAASTPPPAAAAAASPSMSASEASKRLLQLCAAGQAPAAAKVRQLLAAGATLAVTDKSGMTALHMACYWGHAEAAALLLEALMPSGPNGGGTAAAADREGRTPLWVASQRGHLEAVQLLLLRGRAADINFANSSGVTPLRVAAAQGHVEVVEALLAAGARTDVADKDGFTPLYVACARSHLEVAAALLAAGAPADAADKGGRTPLWAALHPGGTAKAEACPERRGAVVRVLLNGGADVHLLPDARDRDYCWQVLAQSIAAGE